MSSAGGRLGDRLVAAGIATRMQVEQAGRRRHVQRGRLGHQLAQDKDVDLSSLASFLEDEIAAGRLETPAETPRAAVLASIPAQLAHLHNVYPLSREGSRVELLVPPVRGDRVLARLGERTGLLFEPRLWPAPRLRELVERDYLGAGPGAVREPALGLTTLIVEDEHGDLRPLSAELRTAELSAEAWLRSALAEAVSAGHRRLELRSGPTEARLAVGSSPERSHALPLNERLLDELEQLVGSSSRGHLLVQLKRRRLLATVVFSHEGARQAVLHLADLRLAAENLDEACADHPEVMDGLERVVADGRGGLVLVVGPDGGGRRRLLAGLAERLSSLMDDSECVGQLPGDFVERHRSGDDRVTAASLHDTLEDTRRGLLVAEDLPGPRSFERALLAASRRLVVAGTCAADGPAALAWARGQGFGGALKNRLLRGVLSVLAQVDRCACAEDRPLEPGLLQAMGLASEERELPFNRGCDECDGAPVHRPRLHLGWIELDDDAPQALIVDDPLLTRRDWRRDRPTPLELAIDAAASGSGELGLSLRLLRGEG